MGYGKVGYGKNKMCSYKHTHNSAEHTKSETAEAGLKLFTSSNIAKNFLLQFARIQQTPNAKQLNVELGAKQDGLLSRHNIQFGTTNQGQGVTGLQIKDADGTFVDYEGQEITAKSQFQINIDVMVFISDKSGAVGYTLSHETFVHAKEIVKVLNKYEQALKNAKDDPTKIAEAITVLKEDLKPYDPNSDKFLSGEVEDHRTIANGTDSDHQEVVKEMVQNLTGSEQEVEDQKNAIKDAREQDVSFQKEDVKAFDAEQAKAAKKAAKKKGGKE